MSKWIDNKKSDCLFMLNRVAAEKNIDELSVEKDWWVSIVLKAIFSTSAAKYMYFKGGTSLSKGWNLINRFSEDIDIALYREYFSEKLGKDFVNCDTKNKREQLRKVARTFVSTELKEELERILSNMGLRSIRIEAVTSVMTKDGEKDVDSDKDPTIINVHYPSMLNKANGYVETKVKVEISCLSMKEPFETKNISSMISEFFEGEDDESISEINTISPTRTFLEKAFLLNEEYQRNTPRTIRMSRHLYDLERLMDTEYAKIALLDIDLYNKIVEHRKKYYQLKGVDYSLNNPKQITFCPTGEILARMEKDYNDMKNSFIYGNPLSFSELIIRIKDLQKRFRLIKEAPQKTSLK